MPAPPQLIAGWIAGGPEANAYRQRAGQIARGWLRAITPGGRDPHTLVCIAQAFPGQAWVQNQIRPTVSYYAAHWPGPWNHGLAQDIKLLRIGCGYPASAFGGAALSWRRTAVAQMSSMFGPNYLGPAIDAQGAVNEQATGYANFVYDLWRGALPMLRACGYRLPPWITQRIAKLPAFLAYATQPDGNLVQIGDTYVERPAAAPKQESLIAVYRGGYVFGRSSWSKTASFYSLRFGRGRQVHGHSDHMGLTYQGWVSHQMLQRIPDDVVEMTRAGGSAQMLTLIAAAAPGTAIRAALYGPAGGPYRLHVRIGAQVTRLTVTASGTIR